jgi:uncharacterized small protein (DUF1192 family)
MTTARKKIDELREKIRTLQGERKGLEAQPRSRSEVRDRVEALVQQWQREVRGEHSRNLRLIAAGQFHSLIPSDRIGHALVLLLGAERVTAALLADIDAVPEGLEVAEREQRIAAIDADLDQMEAEEEALIVCAEDAGERLPRRADARPEVVLGRRKPPPAVRPRSPHYQGRGDVAPKRQRIALIPTFGGPD